MNYLVTGLICSGKSTFLDIAKKYSFDAIKSDDIVSSLYNDESVVFEIEKHLDIKPNQDNLQETVKKLFFTSKKNREIMGATNPEEAKEGTIRKQFALSIEANSVHGSDSAETAIEEIKYFFDESEIL